MSATLFLDFSTLIFKKHISDITTDSTQWIKISMSSGNNYWVCKMNYYPNPRLIDEPDNFVINTEDERLSAIWRTLTGEAFNT